MTTPDSGEATPNHPRGQLPEPTWHGAASCDFCGEQLTPADQLSGACPACARILAVEE